MANAYQAKSELVLGAQLRVQSLKLPFSITGNATPASVVITRDDPSVLFVKTEGVNQITGALDSGDTAPTLASAVDANGVFNVMVKVGEKIKKVVSAKLVRMDSAEIIACTLPSAPSSGIVAGGSLDKIVLNVDSGADLSSASPKYCLEVDYVVDES